MYEDYIYLLQRIGIPEWLGTLIWPVFPFIGVLFIGMFFGVVFLVLMERRTLALLTVRKGPNRVGYDGVFQSFADGIKIIFKEDIMSECTNKIIFTIAPAMVLAPALIIYAVLPFTSQLVASNIAVGLLFVLGISSIHIIALVFAGWASNNKYSLLGGLRAAAQAISYEVPLIIAVISVVILSGSLNLNNIILDQASNSSVGESAYQWLLGLGSSIGIGQAIASIQGLLVPLFSWNLWHYQMFINILGCVVTFVAAIAEVNRIPFDLPEAESELVSGFSTEYSGMKFAMFFMAEYVSLFAIAVLTVVLFFGGYLPFFNDYVVNIFLGIFPAIRDLPFINDSVINVLVHLEQAGWLTFKVWLFIFILMWIRATLPRLRADQLMGFCWKFLLPLSLINLVLITLYKELFLTIY